MSALQPLITLAANKLEPKGPVWLGIAHKPLKFCSFELDPNNLPSDVDCRSLAGLDVVICFHGFVARYGTLRRLYEAAFLARARRIQIVDLDFRKIAFVKLGGAHA
jgi:hypothetical protein